MIVITPLYLPAMLGRRLSNRNPTSRGIESRIMSAQCWDQLRFSSAWPRWFVTVRLVDDLAAARTQAAQKFEFLFP
jgi:hypothetical protein